jgi:hypothetical protein
VLLFDDNDDDDERQTVVRTFVRTIHRYIGTYHSYIVGTGSLSSLSIVSTGSLSMLTSINSISTMEVPKILILCRREQSQGSRLPPYHPEVPLSVFNETHFLLN